jgi:hypothetical protein
MPSLCRAPLPSIVIAALSRISSRVVYGDNLAMVARWTPMVLWPSPCSFRRRPWLERLDLLMVGQFGLVPFLRAMARPSLARLTMRCRSSSAKADGKARMPRLMGLVRSR